MTVEENFGLFKDTINKYVREAIEDYGYYGELRERKYSYKNKKGKVFNGSHPKSLKRAISDIQDMLYSPNRDKLYDSIIKDSKMEEAFDSTHDTLDAEYRRIFKDELIKAELEILHQAYYRNRSRTDIEELENNYIVSTVPIEVPKKKKPELPNNSLEDRYVTKTILELIEIFIARKEQEEIKEINRYRRSLKIFSDLIVKDFLVEITHEDYEDFADKIDFIPNANKHRECLSENCNFKEIIDDVISDKVGKYTLISEKTNKDNMTYINHFLDFCVERDYISKNLLRGKKFFSNSIDKKRRKEYRIEQLNNLFQTDWYTKKLEYNLKNEPEKVWVPLILLFQGFRNNELCQLYVSQIIEEDNIAFFKLKIEFPEQKLKNKSSKRKIPVHPVLIEMGFLLFVKNQKLLKKERLFDNLYYTKNKGYGQAFSKKFNTRKFKETFLEKETFRLIDSEVIMLDLHSFRHNFSGSLKGEIEDSVLTYFMGHSNDNETFYRYGTYRPNVLLKNLTKCIYPNLQLEELRKKINKYYNYFL